MNTLPEECKKVLYDNETERRLHIGAIEVLSVRAGLSSDKVERLYEIVLNRFKREARIRDYLPILVSKRVHYLLDKWRRSGRSDAPGPKKEPENYAY
ncbi:MAG TPA: DUF3562 domain-containing protein [Thermodesulfovibrionales bacterium]|nr:DUF3562 domain-containing protein [Thermodesulfovibrionales bacterium]